MPPSVSAPDTPPPSGGCMRAVGARLGRFCWLKGLGTTAIMSVFFATYFYILRHPQQTVQQIPFTTIDHWIGFHPLALMPYLSLWVYVCLPSSFMVNLRELIGHGIGAVALCAVGLGIFYLWPTSTPPAGIDWSRHPSMLFLKSVDAAGNACPSLHAAFAIFACCWLGRVLRGLGAPRFCRVVNVLWAAAILYSTIATRQHVAIDTLAGALLGWVVVRINLTLSPDSPPCSGSH